MAGIPFLSALHCPGRQRSAGQRYRHVCGGGIDGVVDPNACTCIFSHVCFLRLPSEFIMFTIVFLFMFAFVRLFFCAAVLPAPDPTRIYACTTHRRSLCAGKIDKDMGSAAVHVRMETLRG